MKINMFEKSVARTLLAFSIHTIQSKEEKQFFLADGCWVQLFLMRTMLGFKMKLVNGSLAPSCFSNIEYRL